MICPRPAHHNYVGDHHWEYDYVGAQVSLYTSFCEPFEKCCKPSVVSHPILIPVKSFQLWVLVHPPPAVTLWSCIPSSFMSKVFNCEFLFILLHQLTYFCKSAISSSQGASQKQACYKGMAWKKRMHNTPPQTLLPLVLWAGNISGLMIKLLLPHMVM